MFFRLLSIISSLLGACSESSNGTSPGIYLRDDLVGGVQLSNVSELRAATSEKASFYLDAALASRTRTPRDEAGLFALLCLSFIDSFSSFSNYLYIEARFISMQCV